MLNKPRISHILFTTDLSQNAHRAMEYALSMAEAYQAHITVLHVVEKVPPNAEMLMTSILGYETIDEYRQKTEEELVRRIREHLEQFCGEIENQMARECRLVFKKILVEPGNAAKQIIRHTKTGYYDVLVMGTRGLGLFKEAIMGGTSRKVLHDCQIPVFMVPSQ